MVAGLGVFVYYLLNRPPDPTEPSEPTLIIAGASAAVRDSDSDSDSDTGTGTGTDGDTGPASGPDGAPKKAPRPKKKPVKTDAPKKPAGLVASTDSERKDFFGAMASDVRRCADQHDAAKELVRVAVNVEAGTGKLGAQLRSHKGNAAFASCVVKAFEKRRFKRGKQAFVYNSDYQL